MLFGISSRHFPCLLCCLSLAAAGTAAQPAPSGASGLSPAAREAAEAIRAEGLRAHVRFLADDLLEGRDTGSPGGAVAARYLASQLEQLRLRHAGDAGTYFQAVPLTRAAVDGSRTRLRLTRGEAVTELHWGSDFLLNGSHPRPPVHLKSALVFAGYGVTAPEAAVDDYSGLEVRGKWVVLLPGLPPAAAPGGAGALAARYGSGSVKVKNALRHGAAGVITLLPEGSGGGFPWDVYQAIQGSPHVGLAGAAGPPLLVMHAEQAEPLFAGARSTLPEVLRRSREERVAGFPLLPTAELELAVEQTEFRAPNVAGLLEGGDPQLKREVVVYTAHYDHLGKRPGAEGGVFNGAWDNASGTAGVLEVARAFATLKPAPRRSVLFLFVTGEEKGLLGSQYYVRHPLVPLERTAADINLDMTDIFGMPREFTPVGAEHSSLSRACEALARELGMKVGPDPLPEQHAFTRSDVLSFAEAGVPALFLRWATDYEGVDPEVAKARARERLDRTYHRVTDRFDPDWSWAGMRRHAQVAFLLGEYVAEQPGMPEWNPGDPFAAPRGVPAGP